MNKSLKIGTIYMFILFVSLVYCENNVLKNQALKKLDMVISELQVKTAMMAKNRRIQYNYSTINHIISDKINNTSQLNQNQKQQFIKSFKLLFINNYRNNIVLATILFQVKENFYFGESFKNQFIIYDQNGTIIKKLENIQSQILLHSVYKQSGEILLCFLTRKLKIIVFSELITNNVNKNQNNNHSIFQKQYQLITLEYPNQKNIQEQTIPNIKYFQYSKNHNIFPHNHGSQNQNNNQANSDKTNDVHKINICLYFQNGEMMIFDQNGKFRNHIKTQHRNIIGIIQRVPQIMIVGTEGVTGVQTYRFGEVQLNCPLLDGEIRGSTGQGLHSGVFYLLMEDEILIVSYSYRKHEKQCKITGKLKLRNPSRVANINALHPYIFLNTSFFNISAPLRQQDKQYQIPFSTLCSQINSYKSLIMNKNGERKMFLHHYCCKSSNQCSSYIYEKIVYSNIVSLDQVTSESNYYKFGLFILILIVVFIKIFSGQRRNKNKKNEGYKNVYRGHNMDEKQYEQELLWKEHMKKLKKDHQQQQKQKKSLKMNKKNEYQQNIKRVQINSSKQQSYKNQNYLSKKKKY